MWRFFRVQVFKNYGEKGYNKDNPKIKELNIKIGHCPKQGSGFLSTIDPQCKEKLLKEFSEENNCEK